MSRSLLSPYVMLMVIRDMLTTEAEYRSAMNIYANQPNHMTRIRAESRWHHSKRTAKCIIEAHERTGGQDVENEFKDE